jgi:hypothetical protein
VKAPDVITLISSPFAEPTANSTLVSTSAAALQATGIVFMLDFDISCFAKKPSITRNMAYYTLKACYERLEPAITHYWGANDVSTRREVRDRVWAHSLTSSFPIGVSATCVNVGKFRVVDEPPGQAEGEVVKHPFGLKCTGRASDREQYFAIVLRVVGSDREIASSPSGR